MTTQYRGRLERFHDGVIYGWVFDEARPDARLVVEILIDGNRVIDVKSDALRVDLVRAGIGDGTYSFRAPLPRKFLDDQVHEVTARVSGSSWQLPGSLTGVLAEALSADAGRAKTVSVRPVEVPAVVESNSLNVVPNNKLNSWPNGLALSAAQRFQELASGWLLDYRRGTSPTVDVSIDKPHGLSLDQDQFAMRLSIKLQPSDKDGYVRVIVPIGRDRLPPGNYVFECGLRKPFEAAAAPTIREIFLGHIHANSVTRLCRIRRQLVPAGTMRMAGIRFAVTEEFIEALPGAAADFCLVFDFAGEGEIILFSPSISSRVIRPRQAEAEVGEFEDKRIRDQVNILKLSPIWRRSDPVSSSLRPGPPKPQSAAAPSLQHGVPFTQIIIPVFNAAADVNDVLQSIIKCTSSPFEIILADDGSGAYTKSRMEDWLAQDPRICLIQHEENIGYTRNINSALQFGVADYLVLMNSDILVSRDWLERLHEALNAGPDVAAVGPVTNAGSWQSVPKVKTSDGGWATNPLPRGISVDQFAEMVRDCSAAAFPRFPLLNGFCTLFRRSALEAVDYFDDESFPLGYGEENDLCLRLRERGYSLAVADHCYLYHKKSKSFGVDRRRELSRRSNQILKMKHPSVDFKRLEEEMQVDPVLNALRTRLKEASAIEASVSFGFEESRVAETGV